MEKRIWININDANLWLDNLLGQELYQTKIDSLALSKNIYSIKLSVEYDAKSIRRSSVFDPQMIDPERFDLYKEKGLRLMVMVQYGDVISCYLETM